MTKTLDQGRLREFARSGAEAALLRLRIEVAAIEATFPELATPAKRKRAVQKAVKRGRKMSAKGRMAVSLRMRNYWAQRRKLAARAK